MLLMRLDGRFKSRRAHPRAKREVMEGSVGVCNTVPWAARFRLFDPKSPRSFVRLEIDLRQGRIGADQFLYPIRRIGIFIAANDVVRRKVPGRTRLQEPRLESGVIGTAAPGGASQRSYLYVISVVPTSRTAKSHQPEFGGRKFPQACPGRRSPAQL
jgi:hypothetical protein